MEEKSSSAIGPDARPHFSDTCVPHHAPLLSDCWPLCAGAWAPISYFLTYYCGPVAILDVITKVFSGLRINRPTSAFPAF